MQRSVRVSRGINHDSTNSNNTHQECTFTSELRYLDSPASPPPSPSPVEMLVSSLFTIDPPCSLAPDPLPPTPPPRFKLSLKDFAPRKEKQREEEVDGGGGYCEWCGEERRWKRGVEERNENDSEGVMKNPSSDRRVLLLQNRNLPPPPRPTPNFIHLPHLCLHQTSRVSSFWPRRRLSSMLFQAASSLRLFAIEI
jgi:hypothetical protein